MPNEASKQPTNPEYALPRKKMSSRIAGLFKRNRAPLAGEDQTKMRMAGSDAAKMAELKAMVKGQNSNNWTTARANLSGSEMSDSIASKSSGQMIEEARNDGSRFMDQRREYTGAASTGIQEARTDSGSVSSSNMMSANLAGGFAQAPEAQQSSPFPQDEHDLTHLINNQDIALTGTDVIRAIDSHPENPNLKPPESPSPGSQ